MEVACVNTSRVQGDIGGPAMFLEADGVYTLVGIVTMDVQCQTEHPTTLTRVAMFLDWVSDNSDVPAADSTLKTDH